MKKTTLQLYKELFCVTDDFNDMFYAKHMKMFREKYPDCPQPEALELLEIEVDQEFADGWIDEEGFETDCTRTLITDDIADKILDRKVLEYIDKNVTDPELRANIMSCISPIRPIQQVVFHTEDCFWHVLVRVNEMDTNIAFGKDFWLCPWEDDAVDTENVYVYFTWDRIINTTMANVEVDDNYEEHNTVVMKWNPDGGYMSKEEFMRLLVKYRNGERIEIAWPIAEHKKARIGDRVYFFNLGKGQRGLVAAGTITGRPFIDKDLSGKGIYYVKFKVETMFHPDGYILPFEVLECRYNGIDWNVEHHSTVIMDNEIKDRLEKDFEEFYYDMYLHRPEKFRDRP